MKVLHFIYALSGGGAETQLQLLHKELKNRAIDSVVVCFEPGELENKSDVRMLKRRSKYDFSYIFEMVKYIKSEQPDLIHVWLPAAITIPALACAWIYRVPAVFSYRNKMYFHRAVSYPEYFSALFFAKKIVSNNLISQSSTLFRWLFRRKKGEVIYNAVNIGITKKRMEGTAKRIHKFLFAGRLSSQKNPLFMLKALQKLGRREQWHLNICGKGELEEVLLNAVSNMDLDKNVSFLGYQTDLAEVMCDSDLLIFPSLYEGMPNVLVESLAVGLPVLASDIESSRDIVKDKEAVRWFRVDDVGSLVDALNEYLDNPSVLNNCARNGIELSKKFSVKEMADSYAKLYEGILCE